MWVYGKLGNFVSQITNFVLLASQDVANFVPGKYAGMDCEQEARDFNSFRNSSQLKSDLQQALSGACQ